MEMAVNRQVKNVGPNLFERILLSWTFILPGSNLLGLIGTFGVFLVLLMIEETADQFDDGPLSVVAGFLVIGLDFAYRALMFGTSDAKEFFRYSCSGRMLFVPVWAWGIIWIGQGLIKVAISR